MRDVEKNNQKLKDYNHFLAHELKTPISVIQSNLEVLRYWYNQEKIQNSLDELKAMDGIIGWLLDFSESLQRSEKKEINLENFLKKYIHIFPEEIDVEFQNKEFNMTIYTDEQLFMRVIKNLFENSIKYMVWNVVTIKITQEFLTISNSISHTIPEEKIQEIMKRGNSSAVLSRDGHGLGLPMIAEILANLWYTLSLSSAENMFHAKIEL